MLNWSKMNLSKEHQKNMYQLRGYTLGKLLEALTLEDMHEIRKCLGIKNASQLRKNELVAKLTQDIPEYLEDRFLLLDQERYDIIKAFVNNKGVMSVDSLDDYDFNYFYFLINGMIFRGTHNGDFVFIMPEEVIKKFKVIDNKDYKDVVKRNSDWIMYWHGLIYYYGAIDSVTASDFISRDFGETDIVSYTNVTIEGFFYYQEIETCCMDGELIHYNGMFEDVGVLLDEHKMRKSIDYYPYTKEQFIQAGQPYYYKKTPETRQLEVFLKKHYHFDDEMVDALVEDCTEIIRLSCGENNLSIILDLFSEHIRIKSLERAQELGDIVLAINNNYPMCSLKGYTPIKLKEASKKKDKPDKVESGNIYSFKTGQKISQNDPCPCGSGIKFKKCCGITY